MIKIIVMNYWYITIVISSVISSFAWIIRIKIKEREKRKRMVMFKDFSINKIAAIGDYEKKSKNKYSFPPWKKNHTL